MVNLHRLRLLHHLHTYGTVTATADVLGLTVPAVSQQLAVLEREAGIPLLERTGRRLTFTPAGESLAAHADVVLADVAAAEADLAGLRDGTGGQVRLAVFASAARALLPEVWRALRLTSGPSATSPADAGGDASSAIELFLTEAEPDTALAKLQRGEADIAVIHAYTLLPRDLPPGSEDRPLMDDPVMVALPTALAEDLGVAVDAPVDLASLSGCTRWVAPATDTACHEMLRRACGAAGFVPEVAVTAADFSVITALVAAGAGAALVPRLALPVGLPEGLRLHPIMTPVRRSIVAVTRRGAARRPDVGSVLVALDHAAAQHGGQGVAV